MSVEHQGCVSTLTGSVMELMIVETLQMKLTAVGQFDLAGFPDKIDDSCLTAVFGQVYHSL